MATKRITLARNVCIVAVLAASVPSAVAEPDPEAPLGAGQPWSIMLRQQLLSEKQCVLQEIMTVNEFKVGDEVMLDGRVSCIDGRHFDFARRHEHQKFEIRICEPVVC